MCSKGAQDICMVMHLKSSWHSVGMMRRKAATLAKQEGCLRDPQLRIERHRGLSKAGGETRHQFYPKAEC